MSILMLVLYSYLLGKRSLGAKLARWIEEEEGADILPAFYGRWYALIVNVALLTIVFLLLRFIVGLFLQWVT